MNLALVRNSDNRVVTFLRPDLPEGWEPPADCHVVPEGDLPAGWQRVDDAQPLDVEALKVQMADVFNALPLNVRVALRGLKAAILDAMNDGKLDEVPVLIQQATIPAELEPVRQGLLAMLPAA